MHRFATAAAVLALAVSPVASGEDSMPLPADFHLAYAETAPHDRTLSFEVGADGAVKFRFDEALGAEKIHEEGALALSAAAARRLVAALAGEASAGPFDGEKLPNCWAAPELPTSAKAAPRVELAARSGGRECALTIPWALVDTTQESAAKTDPAWTCLRLRLLELSGVAARIAHGYLDRGNALLTKLDKALLGNLDAEAVAQKLKEGLCAEEDEPYGQVHLYFVRGLAVLDRTYAMSILVKDDSAHTLVVAEGYFAKRRFRGAAQIVQMTLASRLAWYEQGMKEVAAGGK